MFKRLGATTAALLLSLVMVFGACGNDRNCMGLADTSVHAVKIASVQGRGSSGGFSSSGSRSSGGFSSGGSSSRSSGGFSSSGSRTSSRSPSSGSSSSARKPSSSSSARTSTNSSRSRPPTASTARRNPPPARYRASDTAQTRASRMSAIHRLPGGRLPSRITGRSYRYPGQTRVFVFHSTGYYHYGGYHNPFDPFDWTNYYNPLSPWYMHSMSYAGYSRC